jgi:hypothetical protein
MVIVDSVAGRGAPPDHADTEDRAEERGRLGRHANAWLPDRRGNASLDVRGPVELV